MATRCCSPPDNSDGYASSRCSRPTHVSLLGTPLLHRLGRAHHPKHEGRVFGHGHTVDQLEVLKHEPDVATIRLCLSSAHPRQVFAVHHQSTLSRPLLT